MTSRYRNTQTIPLRHPRRGAILLYVLGALLLFAVVVVGLLRIGSSGVTVPLQMTAQDRAQLLAESGLRLVQLSVCDYDDDATNPWLDGTLQSVTLPGGEVLDVEIIPAPPFQITVTATAYAGTAMEARATAIGTRLADCGGGGGGGGGIPGDRPDEYVVFAAGQPGNSPFRGASGSIIDGSIFSSRIDLWENITVTGYVVSETRIRLRSGVSVGGFVCAKDGYVWLDASGTTVAGNIMAFGDIRMGSGTRALADVYATRDIDLEPADARVAGEVHAGRDLDINQGVVGSAVQSGATFSGGKTDLAGATIYGDVHAGSAVSIKDGTNVYGSVYAVGNVSLNDSSIRVRGSIFSGGNVSLGWGTRVDGDIYASGNVTVANNAIIGGNIYTGAPMPVVIAPKGSFGCPPTPPNPKLQQFVVGSENITVAQSTSRVIEPGIYRDINVNGDTTVTLKAGDCSQVGQTGCYVFRSWESQKWGQKLRLDFSAGPDSRITVFISGRMRYSPVIEVSFDGTNWIRFRDLDPAVAAQLSRRVYWEVHDRFWISHEGQSPSPEWFGTMLGVDGVRLASGIKAIGAFATITGSLDMDDANANITYIIADFAVENWVD